MEFPLQILSKEIHIFNKENRGWIINIEYSLQCHCIIVKNQTSSNY